MVADTVMVDSEGTATVLTTSKKDWAAVTYVYNIKGRGLNGLLYLQVVV